MSSDALVAAIESSDDPMAVVVEGRLVLANHACRLLLGDRALGGSVSDYFRIDDQQGSARRRRGRVTHSHIALEVEQLPIDFDGKQGYLCWLADLATASLSPAVFREEENYRQLFVTSTAPQILIDPAALAIVEINDAAANLLGSSRSELIGARAATVFDEQIVASLQHAALAPLRCRWEGQDRTLTLYLGPTRTRQQPLVYGLLHSTDIAELRELAGLQAHLNEVEQLATRVSERLLPLVPRLLMCAEALSVGRDQAAELRVIAQQTIAIAESLAPTAPRPR